MNITIIGAGPIGCYAAYLLAQSGHIVNIYENHKEIGLPIQCTGLLTSDFDQFHLNKESFLINTLTNIEVNTPNHKITFENQKEYLVNRRKFDQFFANLAEKPAQLFILITPSKVRKTIISSSKTPKLTRLKSSLQK